MRSTGRLHRGRRLSCRLASFPCESTPVAELPSPVARRRSRPGAAARPKPSWRVFGPVLIFDLVSQARKPRMVICRTLLVGCLFVGLTLAFLQSFADIDLFELLLRRDLIVPQNRLAQLSECFVTWVLLAQFGVLILLTP